MSVRAWVLLASLLAAVPLWAFSTIATYRLIAEHQQADEQALKRRAAAVAGAVRQRLDRAVAALEALATSDAARSADIAAMHRQAVRIVGLHADGSVVRLTHGSGEPLFSTDSALGAALPSLHGAVLEPVVSDAVRAAVVPAAGGAHGRGLAIEVGLPLAANGRLVLELSMRLPPEAFDAVLTAQRWPTEWVGSVVDSHAIIVARSRDAARFVGTTAPESVRDALAQRRSDVFDAVSKDGAAIKGHAATVPGTGWHVVVGIPKDVFNRDLYQALTVLVLSGAVCLLIGAASAVNIARVVERQMRRVTAELAAPAVPGSGSVRGRGRGRRSLVSELDAVSGVLAQAELRQRELSGRLHAASLDALTGLPSRPLFAELAADLIAQARAEPGQAVGVLFVDLDGFKAINDLHGHPAGDAALRETARVIRQTVREHDVAGRYGGDEFVVCMAAPRELVEAGCQAVAGRLIDGVGRLGGGLGCSIGFATDAGQQLTLDELVERSDAAMLRAKRASKNRWVAFDAELDRPGER